MKVGGHVHDQAVLFPEKRACESDWSLSWPSRTDFVEKQLVLRRTIFGVIKIRRREIVDFSCVYLNSVVFWDVMQRKLVSHRRFGTTYRSHL